ncbi:MAG: hypothetical protein ABS894_00750 [Aerococcus urinaeequi]
MSKPKITLEQVQAIEIYLNKTYYVGDKGKLIIDHANQEEQWGVDCMNRIPMETLCRYLFAPDTVEIELTVDEQLNHSYREAIPYGERQNPFDTQEEERAFRIGMETALRITGRQTPGVITWEE